MSLATIARSVTPLTASLFGEKGRSWLTKQWERGNMPKLIDSGKIKQSKRGKRCKLIDNGNVNAVKRHCKRNWLTNGEIDWQSKIKKCGKTQKQVFSNAYPKEDKAHWGAFLGGETRGLLILFLFSFFLLLFLFRRVPFLRPRDARMGRFWTFLTCTK